MITREEIIERFDFLGEKEKPILFIEFKETFCKVALGFPKQYKTTKKILLIFYINEIQNNIFNIVFIVNFINKKFLLKNLTTYQVFNLIDAVAKQVNNLAELILQSHKMFETKILESLKNAKNLV